MRLSFDHAEILHTAVERVREKADTSDITFKLVDDAFTVAELHDAHEAIKARRYDSRNFRRRFKRMVEDGVVVEAPGKRHRGRARPAKVWRQNH
jgi:8-oxo-dGTP diphosphatase